jgi:hypothetical protein
MSSLLAELSHRKVFAELAMVDGAARNVEDQKMQVTAIKSGEVKS